MVVHGLPTLPGDDTRERGGFPIVYERLLYGIKAAIARGGQAISSYASFLGGSRNQDRFARQVAEKSNATLHFRRPFIRPCPSYSSKASPASRIEISAPFP